MVRRAAELSDSEIADITSKAYDAIINFIDRCVGVNNVIDIDASIEVLRNDELTFAVSVDIKLSPLVNVDMDKIIDESIDRAFQVIDHELSRILEKT